MLTKVLLILFCALAQAQDEPAQEKEASPEPIYAASMSIDDARMNFATVVESFIAARSPKGYWPLKQKSSARVLHLRLEKVLPKTVRKAGGGNVYTGRAALWEVDEDFAVQADFTVDLGGRRWEVKSMRLVSTPPARVPRRKAPPAGKP
ncbi:MAG: hypothetical protein HY926_10390 [Elusimicrobia bacterium]|nr:hypothetical protein [Elusimicrobiota bacterium]